MTLDKTRRPINPLSPKGLGEGVKVAGKGAGGGGVAVVWVGALERMMYSCTRDWESSQFSSYVLHRDVRPFETQMSLNSLLCPSIGRNVNKYNLCFGLRCTSFTRRTREIIQTTFIETLQYYVIEIN